MSYNGLGVKAGSVLLILWVPDTANVATKEVASAQAVTPRTSHNHVIIIRNRDIICTQAVLLQSSCPFLNTVPQTELREEMNARTNPSLCLHCVIERCQWYTKC